MENICRVCLEEDTILIDLKTCRYETQLSYYEIFVECTGIALDETESSVICRSCKDLLSSAYELRVKAKKSTDYLRSKKIEIVEVKCDAVLIEVKEEVEAVQIKEEEQESDDQRLDDVVDNADEEEIRPIIHKKRQKVKKVHPNKIFPWMYRCRYCLNLKNSVPLKHRCERIHIKQNNGLQCNHCDYRSTDKMTLKNHIFTHFFTPTRFQCPKCPSIIFNYKSSLDGHRKQFHSKGGLRLHICQICGRQVHSRKTLKDHQARFHQPDQDKVRKLICDFCGKRFVSRSEVKNHIETVHLNLRKYKCEHCLRLFKRNLNLKLHIESTHQPRKKFICHICGKELRTKNSLIGHQVVHTGEYKYKCPVEGCTSVFKQQGSLRAHQVVHKPVQFHQCEFCPKKFQRSSTLKLHMKEHMPEKMLKCKFCEKPYYLPSKLKEHVARVHEGKRFDCLTCGQGFTKNSNMMIHMKKYCMKGVNKENRH